MRKAIHHADIPMTHGILMCIKLQLNVSLTTFSTRTLSIPHETTTLRLGLARVAVVLWALSKELHMLS